MYKPYSVRDDRPVAPTAERIDIINTKKQKTKEGKMELEQVKKLNREYAGKTPQRVLRWALNNLHPKIALASSFGAEDVIVIDMMMKINPEARSRNWSMTNSKAKSQAATIHEH